MSLDYVFCVRVLYICNLKFILPYKFFEYVSCIPHLKVRKLCLYVITISNLVNKPDKRDFCKI